MARKTSYNWNHDFPKLALESGFSFNVHRPRVYIDWNTIRLLDLNKVVHDRDFAAIDEHVYEVLDCNLESEFDVRILDVGVVKLFRLAQLAVEFLLYCKQYLDRSVVALREDLNASLKDNEKLKKDLFHKESELRKFKKKSRSGSGKATLASTTDNIAAMLLKTLTNGPHIQDSYSKCKFCDKVFLNNFYLSGHIARRHGDQLPDNEKTSASRDEDQGDHQASPIQRMYQKDTEKLYSEIEELKGRLNMAESMLNKKDLGDKADNRIQYKFVTHEEVDNTASHKIQMVGEGSGFEGISLEKFEEWKKAEQTMYLGEIEKLRNQLVDSVNMLKANAEPSVKMDKDVTQLRNDLKLQDDEIKILKKQLDEKVMNVEKSDMSSQLEAQDRVWRSRVISMEQQHKQKIDELMSKMEALSSDIKEAHDFGESEKTKAQQLSSELEEKFAEIKQMEENMKKMAGGTHRRLRNVDSVETLPAYDDTEVSRPPMPKPAPRDRAKLVNSKSTVANNHKIRSKTPSDSTDSDISEKVAPLSSKTPKKEKKQQDQKPKVDIIQALVDARKTSRESKPRANVNEEPSTKAKLIRQSTFTIESAPVLEEAKDTAPTVKVTERPKSAIATDRRQRSHEDLEDSASPSESSISESEGLEVEESEEEKENLNRSVMNAGAAGTSAAAAGAVRTKLRAQLNSRLSDLGANPQSRGLSAADYKRLAAALKQNQTMAKKRNQTYGKIREGILVYLDKRIGKHVSPKKTDESADGKLNRTNRSLTSIFSNVKSRALAMIRTTPAKKRYNESKLLERSMTKRAAAILKTPPSSETNSPKSRRSVEVEKVVETPRKFDYASFKRNQKSLLRSPPKNAIQSKVQKRRGKGRGDLKESAESLLLSNDNENFIDKDDTFIEYSYDLDSAGDSDAIDEERILRDARRAGKRNTEYESQSKSLENLLNSPIRKPDDRVSQSNANLTRVHIRHGSSTIISAGSLEIHEDFDSRESLDNVIEGASNMYDGVSTSESESESSEETKNAQRRMMQFKKSISEENVSLTRKHDSPLSAKGVLKSFPSNGSLAKKKVLFDLESNQMKSMSATPSCSATAEIDSHEKGLAVVATNQTASIKNERDDVWEVSSIDDMVAHGKRKPAKEPSPPPRPVEPARVLDISKSIERQLTGRNTKPPAGSVDVLFQVKSMAPSSTTNVRSGSTTSMGSSLLDGSATSPVKDLRSSRPTGRPTRQNSDLDLSDWSIEDILNDKL